MPIDESKADTSWKSLIRAVFFSGMKVMIDTLNLEKSIYWIMLYITLTGPSLHNDDTKKQTLVMLSSLFFFYCQTVPAIITDG